jgi:hypothetical protein
VVGDDHEIDRESEGVGLVLDESPPDPVHGDAVVGLADAGDELDDLEAGVALTGVMQGKGTVFAAAPEEGSLLGSVHG